MKMNNSNAVFTCLGSSNHTERTRADYDYYATAPKAVEELLKVESFSPRVWECACGEGHISEVLFEHGYDVLSTDLINRGYKKQIGTLDFLQDNVVDGENTYDIITNPPYKHAAEFVERALEISRGGTKIAMLLKIQFLESERRGRLFDENPPKRIWVARRRLNTARNGDFDNFGSGSAMLLAWFVWEKGFKGKPTIDWINKE